jgi:hypothetical protein
MMEAGQGLARGTSRWDEQSQVQGTYANSSIVSQEPPQLQSTRNKTNNNNKFGDTLVQGISIASLSRSRSVKGSVLSPLPALMAPAGTIIIAHETPNRRRTWTPHGQDGWYIGPALEHYQCYIVYIKKTRGERLVETADSPQLK